MSESRMTDIELRAAVLRRLYRAYREEGLYRGVVSGKALGEELAVDGIALERNLEYLIERGQIRMHKIEDLVSITPDGVDCVEQRDGSPQERLICILERIERLLAGLLENRSH